MNKQDLVDQVAARTGHTKVDAAAAVDAVFNAIADALKSDDKVAVSGFGNFEARKVAERMARNPRTGQAVKVPAHRSAKFKPGKALRDSLA
jgi:DNA-binding protein HU-beta